MLSGLNEDSEIHARQMRRSCDECIVLYGIRVYTTLITTLYDKAIPFHSILIDHLCQLHIVIVIQSHGSSLTLRVFLGRLIVVLYYACWHYTHAICFITTGC
jgi:hypothetical protein